MDLDSLQRLTNLTVLVADDPTPYQLRITNTQPGQQLLGIWESNNQVARITLFESSIRGVSGYDLDGAVYGVLHHEVWQHHFGTNHAIHPGQFPTGIDPSLDFRAAGGRCCPDGSWGW